MGERRVTHRALVEKTARKRPLGKPRRRWEDSVKVDVIKIGWKVLNWIDVAQKWAKREAFVNAVMRLLVPGFTGEFLVSLRN
jgi:hypothetical protein